MIEGVCLDLTLSPTFEAIPGTRIVWSISISAKCDLNVSTRSCHTSWSCSFAQTSKKYILRSNRNNLFRFDLPSLSKLPCCCKSWLLHTWTVCSKISMALRPHLSTATQSWIAISLAFFAISLDAKKSGWKVLWMSWLSSWAPSTISLYWISGIKSCLTVDEVTDNNFNTSCNSIQVLEVRFKPCKAVIRVTMSGWQHWVICKLRTSNFRTLLIMECLILISSQIKSRSSDLEEYRWRLWSSSASERQGMGSWDMTFSENPR